jgi:hypothetical protein
MSPEPRGESAQQCTVTVDISRDWADWALFYIQIATLIGTVIAVFLAYGQIKQARQDAKAAQTAQLKERRVDFELTVLRELLIAANRVDHLHVQALALTLTPSVVPITRAAAQLPTTRDAERMAARLSLPEGAHPTSYLDSLKEQVTTELVKAIDKRVHEREPIR